jgi:hypothetical protein
MEAGKSIAVTVITVIPVVMVVAVIVAVMVVAAVIIAVPPATRLGLAGDEYASEQKCYERANDDLHGVYLALGTNLLGLTERHRDRTA